MAVVAVVAARQVDALRSVMERCRPGSRLVTEPMLGGAKEECVLLWPVDGAADQVGRKWIVWRPGGVRRCERVNSWKGATAMVGGRDYPPGDVVHFQDAIEDEEMMDIVRGGRNVASLSLEAGDTAAADPPSTWTGTAEA